MVATTVRPAKQIPTRSSATYSNCSLFLVIRASCERARPRFAGATRVPGGDAWQSSSLCLGGGGGGGGGGQVPRWTSAPPRRRPPLRQRQERASRTQPIDARHQRPSDRRRRHFPSNCLRRVRAGCLVPGSVPVAPADALRRNTEGAARNICVWGGGAGLAAAVAKLRTAAATGGEVRAGDELVGPAAGNCSHHRRRNGRPGRRSGHRCRRRDPRRVRRRRCRRRRRRRRYRVSGWGGRTRG